MSDNKGKCRDEMDHDWQLDEYTKDMIECAECSRSVDLGDACRECGTKWNTLCPQCHGADKEPSGETGQLDIGTYKQAIGRLVDAEEAMWKMADFLRETYVVQTAMTPEELNKALAHHKAYIKRWEVSDE